MVINDFVHSEIVNKINLKLKVSSFLVGTDLYLNSCNWKWMQLTNKLNIDGIVYVVNESDNLAFDFMVNDFVGTTGVFKLLNFHFYEGTAMDVTTVFQSISNIATEKLPMCWLAFNPLPIITRTNDKTQSHKIGIDCTVYLAGLTDYGTRRTKEHMSEVVKYLSFYSYAIESAMDWNPSIGDEFTINEKQLPIFGSLGKGGFVQNILDETNLSAIEMKMSFKTDKICYC
jgi:hypothetical protein